MKRTRKQGKLPAVIAVAVGGVFLLAIAASAFMGGSEMRGNSLNEKVREQLEKAIESQDYDAWRNTMAENNIPMTGMMGMMAGMVNRDNFQILSQMHEAMEQGNHGKAAGMMAGMMMGSGMPHAPHATGMEGMKNPEMCSMMG